MTVQPPFKSFQPIRNTRGGSICIIILCSQVCPYKSIRFRTEIGLYIGTDWEASVPQTFCLENKKEWLLLIKKGVVLLTGAVFFRKGSFPS